VAAGEFSGDGRADVVTGAGPGGGPHVKVFGGADGAVLASYLAYAPGFAGGVRVGVAPGVAGGGLAGVVTAAGPGGGPHAKVFSGAGAPRGGFLAFDPAFLGGVFVG
jgi:serralysin